MNVSGDSVLLLLVTLVLLVIKLSDAQPGSSYDGLDRLAAAAASRLTAFDTNRHDSTSGMNSVKKAESLTTGMTSDDPLRVAALEARPCMVTGHALAAKNLEAANNRDYGTSVGKAEKIIKAVNGVLLRGEAMCLSPTNVVISLVDTLDHIKNYSLPNLDETEKLKLYSFSLIRLRNVYEATEYPNRIGLESYIASANKAMEGLTEGDEKEEPLRRLNDPNAKVPSDRSLLTKLVDSLIAAKSKARAAQRQIEAVYDQINEAMKRDASALLLDLSDGRSVPVQVGDAVKALRGVTESIDGPTSARDFANNTQACLEAIRSCAMKNKELADKISEDESVLGAETGIKVFSVTGRVNLLLNLTTPLCAHNAALAKVFYAALKKDSSSEQVSKAMADISKSYASVVNQLEKVTNVTHVMSSISAEISYLKTFMTSWVDEQGQQQKKQQLLEATELRAGQLTDLSSRVDNVLEVIGQTKTSAEAAYLQIPKDNEVRVAALKWAEYFAAETTVKPFLTVLDNSKGRADLLLADIAKKVKDCLEAAQQIAMLNRDAAISMYSTADAELGYRVVDVVKLSNELLQSVRNLATLCLELINSWQSSADAAHSAAELKKEQENMNSLVDKVSKLLLTLNSDSGVSPVTRIRWLISELKRSKPLSTLDFFTDRDGKVSPMNQLIGAMKALETCVLQAAAAAPNTGRLPDNPTANNSGAAAVQSSRAAAVAAAFTAFLITAVTLLPPLLLLNNEAECTSTRPRSSDPHPADKCTPIHPRTSDPHPADKCPPPR